MDIQLSEEQLASIEAHRAMMITAGYSDIVGTVPVLLPSPPGNDEPVGTFQVWWSMGDEFVHVDDRAGETAYLDFLPVPEDFEA